MLASVEAPLLVPPGATRARIEVRFSCPAEGVTFQPAVVEVAIDRPAD